MAQYLALTTETAAAAVVLFWSAAERREYNASYIPSALASVLLKLEILCVLVFRWSDRPQGDRCDLEIPFPCLGHEIPFPCLGHCRSKLPQCQCHSLQQNPVSSLARGPAFLLRAHSPAWRIWGLANMHASTATTAAPPLATPERITSQLKFYPTWSPEMPMPMPLGDSHICSGGCRQMQATRHATSRRTKITRG